MEPATAAAAVTAEVQVEGPGVTAGDQATEPSLPEGPTMPSAHQ